MKRVALLLLLAGCDLLIPTPTVIGGGERPREGEGDEGEGEEGEGEEGEGDVVGEGEGDVVGEGEGDVVGEGEGDVVGEGEGEEGEGDAGGGPGLHAQLTWTGSTSDLDVRGVADNDNGDFCAPAAFFDGAGGSATPGPIVDTCTPSAQACTFSNCKSSGARPDWDGSGGVSDGDPIIDIDDVSGFGPENLDVAAAADGSYVFGAFAYNTDLTTECATLTVFINRTSQLVRTIAIDESTWVEVARVDVVGGAATVTALRPNDTCP